MKKKTNDNNQATPSSVTDSVASYIAALKESERFGSRVVGETTQKPVVGSVCPIDFLIGPLQKLLVSCGIDHLYSHQREALDNIFAHRNVIVSTATASGKSLIYTLPVLQALYAQKEVRALFLFPLKALARDQVSTIAELYNSLPAAPSGSLPEIAAVYDGDTSAYKRKKIRESPPTVLVTNPDMLHLSMLPYHEKWGKFLAGLRYIVIDEVHTYRGVFGAHVAWIIRRLRRICSLYGVEPVFILTSATVGNPGELAETLVGQPFVSISKSGARSGRKDTLLINPVDSAAGAATIMLEAAVRRNLRTIIYSQSRKMTELITIWAGRRLKGMEKKIASYRAGFLPEDRRTIEKRLSSGDLLGVISTSALELGIDIGSLDICILVGYPGSIMAAKQRGGRVGRNLRDALVIMLGHDDALDQYFMRHPEEFFTRPVESVILDPANPYILRQQIVCAAAEEPLHHTEIPAQNLLDHSILEELTMSGELLRSADGNTWFSARKYPQRHVNIRGSGESYSIYLSEGRTKIGDIDGHRVFTQCHDGAVYLHMAETFLVDRLDLDDRAVYVRRSTPSYFTRATVNKETEIEETYSMQNVGATRVFFGRIRVREQVTGYARIQLNTMRTIKRVSLDLPPQTFVTEGFWIIVPSAVNRKCVQRQLHFMGGIHALEHAVIGILPLFVLCDRNDIGGISYPYHLHLDSPAVFVYDGCAGGIGLTRKGFEVIAELLKATEEIIASCRCELGCPTCVHSPKCGSGNRPIDKAAALFILECLISPGCRVSDSPLPLPGFLPERRPKAPAANNQDPQCNWVPENYCVFDLETKYSAQEVGGWSRADKMGMSVAVLFNGKSRRYTQYLESDVKRLISDLRGFDLVVGFNNKRFDNKVLSAYTTTSLASLPSIDILELIHNQLGYRISLDRLGATTLGRKKQGDGLQALAWYRQRDFDKLFAYCLEDVRLTRDLFIYGLHRRFLLFTNKSGNTVRLPVDFNQAVRQIVKRERP